MKMNQLEDVESPHRAQFLDRRDEIRGVQTEFGFLAPALLPPPKAPRRELDPDTRRRLDLHLVGDLEEHVDLAQLLQDNEHLMAELLTHEGEAHELLVLVAVANDDVVRRLGQTENRLELRLAAALQADAVRLPKLENFLDDVALLVDLDRVYGRVAAGIPELLTRLLEARRECFDA